jgi:CBS domain-containing protein
MATVAVNSTVGISSNQKAGEAMINRKLADIVKGQKLVALAERETVQEACRYMWEHRTGSVLVLDDQQRLTGIFTGRDAVRTLAEGKSAQRTPLGQAMTPNPITISPDNRAIDALREMCNRGFRHLPVVGRGKIWGVVSRNDFLGTEIDRLDDENHLWECIR